MPVIEVTVSPHGTIKLETRGFTGPACQEATHALEAALGLVQTEERTLEFFELAQETSPLTLKPDTDL